MKRLLFDALCTSAIANEAQAFVGVLVGSVGAPGRAAVALVMRCEATRGLFVLSAAPEYPCAFVLRDRIALADSEFADRLKRHLKGRELTAVRQVGFDRTLELTFDDGALRLYALLFGTHANLVLGSADGKIIAVLRKSATFQPGSQLVLEPPKLASLEEALERHNASGSRTLALSLDQHGAQAIRDAVTQPKGFVHSDGAYPLPLQPSAEQRESFSNAVAEVFFAVEHERTEKERKQAITRIEREIEAKERALRQVEVALDIGNRARELQVQAELLLAYQHQVPKGASEFRTTGYDGEEVVIRLNTTLTPIENAQRLFEKARRAKAGRKGLLARREALRQEIVNLRELLESPVSQAAESEAKRKPRRREEKSYEGHKIRETEGPRGFVVLWGTNAEANDYLTRRVARPNDIWLHARGATGSHVVIRTNNKPDGVPRETILFAAHIAAWNSSQKHAGLVPVAYTLAKYVRRPRRAPPGTVTLSKEKVVFVRPRRG